MSATFLDTIIEKTRLAIDAVKRGIDVDALRDRAVDRRRSANGHGLREALDRKTTTNIIAEIKRASPSRGVINDSIDIGKLAQDYEAGGAAAISVLTERDHFRGCLDDLRMVRAAVRLPVLRKDFIIDEYQIYEAADAGADAVLLIVAALGEHELKTLLGVARALKMDALVEVHTAAEMKVADGMGADMIGVNNRDLHSLEVSIDVSRKLIEHRPAGALMVTESGLSNRIEIDELKSLGFDGFLIGEALMRSESASDTLGGWI